MRFGELREELVRVLRSISVAGLVLGAAGNASARVPGDELVVISPTAIPYDRVRAEDVAVVTPSGDVLEGERPSVELPMHLRLLAARPEVGGVVHTHSPHATALAFAVDELAVVTPELAAAVGGAVPVCPYTPAGGADAGEAVLQAARGRWAVVVRNHGPVCLGRGLADALACAFAVEEAAHIFWLARSVADPKPLAPEEVARVARLAGKLP